MTGEVLIPPMVAHEFSKNSAEIPLPNWIKVQELDDLHQIKAVEFAKRIDDGESAAIALTLQSQATWLLSDDTKARQFAESLGLEVHGSIGLLLWGVAANHVANRTDAYGMLDALANSSLWVSERVLQEARKAIEIIFSK
jgi:predicted nucleic acid-binding protein